MDFGFSHIKADSCLKVIVLNINGSSQLEKQPRNLFGNLEFNTQIIDQIESRNTNFHKKNWK